MSVTHLRGSSPRVPVRWSLLYAGAEMATLDENQLRLAHDAAVACGLDRDALLAELDRPIVALLTESPIPSARIWGDLCALRDMGSSLLRRWMKTAAMFAGPRAEAAVFRDLAARLATEEGMAPQAPWTGVWVGRDAEMGALAAALVPPTGAPKPVAICALQGMAGVGKTYLAERFAWTRSAAFPGGVKRLALRPGEASTATSLLGELAAQLRAPAAQSGQVCALLRATGALVHVDNADDKGAAEAADDLARALPGCALIVTGRYGPLGDSGNWTVVRVALFDEPTALALLAGELGRAIRPDERAALGRLAHALGYLPLALGLAAAHLRDGLSPDDFLAQLRDDRLDVDHPDPARGDADARRRNVARTLSLSLDLLRRSLGARAEALLAGLRALGHAPAVGVGVSLGAAISGLSRADFLRLVTAAARLALLDLVAGTPPRWRMHPLLGELVRDPTEGAPALARMSGWFVARLPEESDADPRPLGERWTDVHEETAAMADWLDRVPPDAMPGVVHAGSWYAQRAGPFAIWAAFCERLLTCQEDSVTCSNALWTLGNVARWMGDLDRALDVARRQQELDRTAGRERDAALAVGLRADILQARGQLDEALRIRRHDELPVYEKLDDVRSRAVTLGKIADILQARGQLDEALHIRQHDQLPVYEKLGDIRERAVTLGKIADILQARGQLDEALRIRRHDELPAYEKLGARRDILVCQAKTALTHLARSQDGDRRDGERLLRRALAAADGMGLPEAEAIRSILRTQGFDA